MASACRSKAASLWTGRQCAACSTYSRGACAWRPARACTTSNWPRARPGRRCACGPRPGRWPRSAASLPGGLGGEGGRGWGAGSRPGERAPRVIELHGDEIQQVHHAYGTNGVILDVEVALSPAVEWRHCPALFPGYRGALDFCIAAQAPALDIFLLSSVEARFSPWDRSLGERFPSDRHAVFTMVAPDSMAPFRALVAGPGGRISVAGHEPELRAQGLPPAYECAFNHTTLQALKADRRWTYLQVASAAPFEPAVVERHLRLFGGDVLQHQDFARVAGQCCTFGILLVRWKGREHQYQVMREIEAQGGCRIFNPHVVTIEDGGMKTIDAQQIEFKQRSDPMGLMNPGKTRGWRPALAARC